MEAIVAVGLTSNIIQFVEVGKKLVCSAQEIYDHGASLECLELETTARRLRQLAEEITFRRLELGGNIEFSLNELCAESIAITNQLLSILDKLKLNEREGVWKSAKKVLQAQWEKERVKDLEAKMDRIGNAMIAQAVLSQQYSIARKLKDMEKMNQKSETKRVRDMESLIAQVGEMVKSLEKYRGPVESGIGGLEPGKKSPRKSRRATPPLTLSGSLSHITAQEAQYSAEQIILGRYSFDGMANRYDAVSVAHGKTFGWVFGSGERTDWSSTFKEWLGSDDRTFWITGKPGSGKSTLTKYIWNHKKTKETLEEWAGENPVIMANYFFWSASKSQLVKSQEGLLRSLIHQILRQSPETIAHVHPELLQFRTVTLPSEAGRNIFARISYVVPETASGLLSVLGAACESPTLRRTRLCFFIDGLDEYGGRPADIIDLVQVLQKLPNLKLCVSSRPWNEFDQCFGQDRSRKLYMHDLNRQDIRTYVYDTLSRDKNFAAMDDVGAEGDLLKEEIATLSSGVFLWVFLVLQSFKEGLSNGDTIQDLRRRLRVLPAGLTDFYEKILLTDVDRIYRQEAARMLKATVAAKGRLPLMTYWFLGSASEDPGCAFEPIRRCSIKLVKDRKAQLEKRLNARSKGLLNVTIGPFHKQSEELNGEVELLHRTVKDFLNQPNTKSTLESWDKGSPSPDFTICHAIITQLKSVPRICETGYIATVGAIEPFLRLFFSHCRVLHDDEQFSAELLHRLLDEFNEAVQNIPVFNGHRDRLVMHWYSTLVMADIRLRDLNLLFWTVCLNFGLHRYISRKLSAGYDGGDKRWERYRTILLYQALKLPETGLPGAEPEMVADTMIKVLLESGADPNAPVGERPCNWAVLLYDLWQQGPYTPESVVRLRESYVRLFLDHGADPDAEIWVESVLGDRPLKCYYILCQRLSADSMADIIAHHFRHYSDPQDPHRDQAFLGANTTTNVEMGSRRRAWPRKEGGPKGRIVISIPLCCNRPE